MVRPMRAISANPQAQPSDSGGRFLDELPVSYVEINADGVITLANRAARALHPADQGEIVGRRVWEFSPESLADSDRSSFLAVIDSGEDPPVTRRLLYSRGEFRTYELHRTLMRDAEDRPVGIRAVDFDVTEAQVATEEANRSRMWLESVLDSMPDAVFITDALGFIRSVNPAAEEMFGWKAAELNGKLVEKMLPLLKFASDDAKHITFNLSLERRCRGIATILDRERKELVVEICTSPVVDKEHGYTAGVVSVLRRVKALVD